MKIHIVKKGDTMYEIAKKYNVDLQKLIDFNKQIADPDKIDVGMKIRIPTSPVPVTPPVGEIMHKHTVVQGDTLWKLSKAWGVPLKAVIDANPHLKNPNILMTGDTVFIPKVKPMHGTAIPGANNKVSTAPIVTEPAPAPVPAPEVPANPEVVQPEAPKQQEVEIEVKVEKKQELPFPQMPAMPELPKENVKPLATAKPTENAPAPKSQVSPAAQAPKKQANTQVAPLQKSPKATTLPATPGMTGLSTGALNPWMAEATEPFLQSNIPATQAFASNAPMVSPYSSNSAVPNAPMVSPYSSNPAFPNAPIVSPYSSNPPFPNEPVVSPYSNMPFANE
ncbi:LysM peptidoglycan-binding domain-containing protein, partial [Paenibacillus koleovorans]|uniref:LysM peptidoglycan-binding domain-containing protein n=1 Tax=Paenibacillus koleovorans TaxID=121608 RepID=UPI000FD92F66